MDLRDLRLGFRDDAQQSRTQAVVHDRLADDRLPNECRYLMRFWWQLSMGYQEVTADELREYVCGEKLRAVEALIAAIARSPEAVDDWLLWATENFPEVADRGVAVDAVRDYLTVVVHVRGQMFADFPGISGVNDLLNAVRRTRQLPRAGRSSSGVEYTVHGAGCRMIDQYGNEIDLDVVAGVEVFDAWRVARYLEEEGEVTLTPDQLSDALRFMAARGDVDEIEAGRWYAIPGSA